METLIGTWELVSAHLERSDGSRHHYLGAHPRGRLTYTRDGNVHAILSAEIRPCGGKGKPSDTEKIALFETSLGYTGSFRAEGSTVTHSVEVSTHEEWVGRDMVRHFRLDGDQLYIMTAPELDPQGEQTVVFVLEWKRLAARLRG